jgi:hypothetical protein
MSEIQYELYSNPLPTMPPIEVWESLADYDSGLLCGVPYPKIVTSLLERVSKRTDLPEDMREWRDTANHWAPPDVLDWLMGQIDQEEQLDDVSREWICLRVRDLVVARQAGQPIGTIARTHITGYDRYPNSQRFESDQLLVNEIRCFVVDEESRNNKAARVGSRLVREIISATYSSSRLPTIAVTTNPVAAKTFKAAGAVGVEDFDAKQTRISKLAVVSVACWCPSREYCEPCPQRPGQLWYWPTDRKDELSLRRQLSAASGRLVIPGAVVQSGQA